MSYFQLLVNICCIACCKTVHFCLFCRLNHTLAWALPRKLTAYHSKAEALLKRNVSEGLLPTYLQHTHRKYNKPTPYVTKASISFLGIFLPERNQPFYLVPLFSLALCLDYKKVIFFRLLRGNCFKELVLILILQTLKFLGIFMVLRRSLRRSLWDKHGMVQ